MHHKIYFNTLYTTYNMIFCSDFFFWIIKQSTLYFEFIIVF